MFTLFTFVQCDDNTESVGNACHINECIKPACLSNCIFNSLFHRLRAKFLL